MEIITKSGTSIEFNEEKLLNYSDVAHLLPHALDRFIFFTVDQNHPFWIEVDFGRAVGTQDVVYTDEDDEIVYAKRHGVTRLSRFVMDREPEPTTKMTLVLRRITFKKFQLIAAHFGDHTPMEPNDPRIKSLSDLEHCEKFWSTHAFIWGTKEVED